MKHLKKMSVICAMTLACTAAAAALPAEISVFAEQSAAASGTCGESLRWTLDDAGTLTISGTGKTPDYNYDGGNGYGNNPAPWGTEIRKVIVEEGVTALGDDAFYYCKSLSEVQLPDSLTVIGDGAFYTCEALTSVTVPKNVEKIEMSAFARCTNLETVSLPEGLQVIDTGAFIGCEKLKSINFPKSVKTIDSSAFCSCESLTSVTVQGDVDFLGYYVFGYCFSLKEVHLLGKVKELGEGAFEDDEALTTVTLPDTLETIGSTAFLGCRKLTDLLIPASVTQIDDSAFKYCDALTLKGYTGTYAEQFAQSHGIPFTSLGPVPEPKNMRGDFDGDDVWNENSVFRRCFDPDPQSQKGKFGKYLRKKCEWEPDSGWYPEQYDITYDFVQRMCAQFPTRCDSCVLSDSITKEKFELHCIGGMDGSEKKVCPVMLMHCGYNYICTGEKCELRKKMINLFSKRALDSCGKSR